MREVNQGEAPYGGGVAMPDTDIMPEHDTLPKALRLLMQHTRTPFRLRDVKEGIRIFGYKGLVGMMLREIERIEGYNPAKRDPNLAKELDTFIYEGASYHATQSN